MEPIGSTETVLINYQLTLRTHSRKVKISELENSLRVTDFIVGVVQLMVAFYLVIKCSTCDTSETSE